MVINGEMNLLLGEYQLSFTGQGRVVLPKRIRESLLSDNEVILSRGLDGCIWGYESIVWEEEARKQLEVSITDKSSRDLRRYLFSAAEKTPLDDQGRFVIPVSLMDYAKLNGRVVLIGAGDHFEIWDLEKWRDKINEITDSNLNF